MDSESIFALGARLHLLGLGKRLVNRADHVERLLRNVVVLPFHNFLEAAHRVRNLYVFPLKPGELRGDEHGLRQKFLNLAGACHGALVLIGKFFDAENGDDVLQILVALQNQFHAACHGIVLRADDARIENARGAGQWIDRRINAALDDLSAQVRRGIKMRKGRGRCGVRIVVGGNINRLHRSNRSALGRSDALLQLADFGVEVGLVADGRRHAPEKRRYFRTRLDEAENVVDEQKHVQMLLIAKIYRDRKAGETNTQTRTGRLRHLTVNQSGTGLFRIARNHHARFLELDPQVISFAGALAHARENRNASVLHGHVVNQFLNKHRLAHAGAPEEPDLPALQERLDQVNDLNPGLEHFEVRRLIHQQRRGTVNLVVGIAREWP